MRFTNLFSNVALLLALAISYSVLNTHTLFTVDTWWQIAQGKELWEHGNYTHDTFSYTAPGAALHLHAWLSMVIFYLLTKVGGLPLLEIFGATVVALIIRVHYSSCRKLKIPALLSLAACIVFFFCSRSLILLRPQLFSFLGIALIFNHYIAYKFEGRQYYKSWPFLFCLWSNLHGEFIFGLFLIGCFCIIEFLETPLALLRQDWKKHLPRGLLLTGFASVLTSIIHPDGIQQYVNVLAHDPFAVGINSYINEWLAPSPIFCSIFYLTIFGAVVVSLLKTSLPTLFESSLLLGSMYLGLSGWRHVPIFGLIGVPILVSFIKLPDNHVITWLNNFLDSAKNTVRDCIIIVCIVCCSSWYVIQKPYDVLQIPYLKRLFPIDGIAWLQQHPTPGNVFNSYEFGGLMMYTLGDLYKVYIDSRLSLYKDIYPDEYFNISNADGNFVELIKERNIKLFFINPYTPIKHWLDSNDSWTLAYSDKQCLIYISKNRGR